MLLEGETLDCIQHIKEMIYFARTNPNDWSMRGIARPVRFVGPDMLASELLRVFTEEHMRMAIVRSAAGRTLGLVTLEDIVEELVGELEDEFDRLPRMLHPLSGGVWMVGGGILVQELSDKLGLPMPSFRGTPSAWLIESLGRIPRTGKIVRQIDVEFTVRRTRRGKVFEVSVAMRREPER